MADPSSRRKLAAILSADVVGYSSLMAANEAATIETLKSYRDIIARLVVRRGGRVINAPGDALLAEFPSAVEAVQAAIEIQKSLEGHNIELEPERRMQFRIGVNLGDVIEEADGTIYGDGVNIAARMEALAEGGGVCIASTVYDAVEGKLSFGFDFLGEQQVKNISKPVRVYRVRAEPRPTSARSRSKRRIRWQITVPALALILVLGAVGAWFYRDLWVPAPDGAAEHPVLDAFNVPSIAVLPFVNLSGDANQEYFSDGLTEDLITQLSRASRDLRVLARNTAFQYKGKAVDVSKLGRELGVRYVLEGSVQRTEDDLRVAAQLIDTQTGAHVWADRFDRKIADIFLVQDEIISQIVGEIAGSYGAIERNEAKAAARKSPGQIQAYDLVLRARAAIQWDWTSETFGAARQALQQAIALDPTNSQARRELAWLGLIGWIFRVDATPTAPQDIIAEATKAVQLDPADARARMVAAMGYFFAKQLDLFKREADQALELAPYDAELQATLGCMFSSMGDRQRGVALVTKANALNPDAAAGWYHSTIYTADYLNGDYRHALEVTRQNPQGDTFYAHIEYTPIYGQLGMKQEALDIWHKLQAQVPGASTDTFANWWRLWNFSDEEVAKLMEGVHKSGVLGAEAKPSL
jgi:adenylate cyclase